MILISSVVLIGGAFALAVYFSETHFTPPYLRRPKTRAPRT